jgi:hypothetical protein
MQAGKNSARPSAAWRAAGATFAAVRKLTAARYRTLGWVALGAAGLSACSAVPVKMQCSEIQARIDYSDMSGDQLRFAQQELEDCRARQSQAEKKDSGFVEGMDKRFTPDSDSGQADSVRN